MRSFLLPSRGDANAPARSVEQPAASEVPSSLEQPADSFTSINALTVWLKAQGDASSSPELRRLRAAVAVLAKKPNPKQEDVRRLGPAWDVQVKRQKKHRPTATLIAEVRQAVLAEGTRLRARGRAAQLGVSASSAPPLAKPAFASAAASSAAQPASIDAVPSRVVRPVEFASGKRCLDAFTSCETGEETSAAQPGSNARNLRVESGYEVSRGQRGHQAEPLRERIR